MVTKAHRFSYELANGAIPDGRVIDHMCHTPACVNPDHLRAVTPKQNSENRKGATRRNSSGFRGVNKNGNKWYASIGRNGRPVSLGSFDTAEEAAQVALEARLAEYTHNDVDRAA